MKTEITDENPFGPDRYGYLWEALRKHGREGNHLDFGTYDGAVPRRLLETGVIEEAWAADVVDVVGNHRRSHGDAPDGLHLTRVNGKQLPFDDQAFDSVSLLDVLEHIADQGTLLNELHRVTKKAGLLVVTVPKRYALSFLDTGNWKFLFPNLHAWYYTRRHSEAEYQARYQSPSNGLVGDIEIEKSWHEHFRPRDLADLLRSNGFEPFDLDGAGFFARPLSIARYAAPRSLGQKLAGLARWDARTFRSAHLFSASRKK